MLKIFILAWKSRRWWAIKKRTQWRSDR